MSRIIAVGRKLFAQAAGGISRIIFLTNTGTNEALTDTTTGERLEDS